jgi:colanic acid/amylovoran biosynthesis glycosyltransferase
MKIAHLQSTFPVISETFILNQISGLLQDGHDITIFAESHPEEPVEHELITKYDIYEKVVYSGQPDTYLEGAQLLVDTVSDLLSLGYSPYKIATQFRHGKAAPRRLGKIREMLRHGGNEDLLHAHFGPVGNTSLPLQQMSELPLIVSFYGYDVSSIPRSNPNIYEDLFDRTDAITCLSEDMKKDLIDLGGPEEKIQKLPLCIDPTKFEYKERKLEPQQPIQILTVARLVEKKGLKYAIEAVAQLDLKYPITYSIAGDGPQRKQLEAQVAELNAEDRINILGWQTQEEIVQLMNESHVFLLPSVTAADGNKEGTPTALLEAQSAGLPIVSTTHAGIPEIVGDRKAGYLAPERDVPALVDALEELLSQPKQWSDMGQAGREYVESNHSVKSVTDQLVSLYEQTITQTN